MAEVIKDEIGNSYRDMTIQYSHEETPLGTGGAIKRAATLTDGKPFIAMNGDDWLDIKFANVISYYNTGVYKGLIIVKYLDDIARYGSVDFNKDTMSIIQFNEKGIDGEGYISTGIYILTKDLINSMNGAESFSIEYEGFPNCKEYELGAYPTNAKFIDIGTPESYLEAQEYIK